jgi:UDP-N-acetylmuramate--alanine ligase
MKILCVGAGGSGMAAIVRWHLALHDTVVVTDDMVSASDLLTRYPGAVAWDASQSPTLDRIVFSDAIPAGHPLRTYASERGIPVKSFSEELGVLCEGRRVIAIAGTHGKSTTTALLSWALAAAGKDPLCVIGADVSPWKGNFRWGDGPVVVEADEYKKHFLALRPETIVVTSLEMDHFDTYSDERPLLQTFVEFCSSPSVRRVFIARAQPMLEALAKVLAAKGTAVFRFGAKGDFVAIDEVRYKNGNCLASLTAAGNSATITHTAVTCPHISNLTGVVAVLLAEKIPSAEIRKGISSFPGIRRRLERIGSLGRVEIYSDYAHHPTAVAETLAVCKKIWPSARIGVLFEPHERLRTSRLRSEYAGAFGSADAVGLLPVYDPVGRERKDIEDAARHIAADNIFQLPDYEAGFAWMQRFIRDSVGVNAIIVVMGAGPVDARARNFFAKIGISTQVV